MVLVDVDAVLLSDLFKVPTSQRSGQGVTAYFL